MDAEAAAGLVGLAAVVAVGYAIWQRNRSYYYDDDDGYEEVWYYEETWYED